MSTQYDKSFFVNRRSLTQASAQIILNIIFPILKPNSVLDIGCATGIWLAEAINNGAGLIQGIDGPWVPVDELEISRDNFVTHDISESPPDIKEKFDLALCIELAEHLNPTAGGQLVERLTKISDSILFSAAIPGQGGTGHVNENIQSYWQKIFASHNFSCFDLIRPLLWSNSQVNVIYKQNMLLYVKKGTLSYLKLQEAGLTSQIIEKPYELDRVHPELFLLKAASAVKKPSKTKKIKNTIKGLFK